MRIVIAEDTVLLREGLAGLLEDAGHELLQRDEDRVEEVLGVGVARVERQPGHRVGGGGGPLAHGDGLARPRRTGDDDEARPRAPEGVEEALAADRVGR